MAKTRMTTTSLGQPAGQTPKSVKAFDNLKKKSAKHLKGRYTIEVIDLVKNPKLAGGDQILVIPTLVRKLPQPIKKIIGDLSNKRAGVGWPGSGAKKYRSRVKQFGAALFGVI